MRGRLLTTELINIQFMAQRVNRDCIHKTVFVVVALMTTVNRQTETETQRKTKLTFNSTMTAGALLPPMSWGTHGG